VTRRLLTDEAELIALIGAVKRSAHRWEHQPFYDEPGEAEMIDEWEAGGPGVPPFDGHIWVNQLDEMQARGAELVRVRVQDHPLPRYQRWLDHIATTWSIPAGEQIRVMPRSRANLIRPLLSGRHQDWWLLDNERIVILNVDDRGRRVSTELREGGLYVARARAWWDLAVRLSTPVPSGRVLTPT
jgi:hypothetical protein